MGHSQRSSASYHAVELALSQVMEPLLAQNLIADSLRAAGLIAIPETRGRLISFLRAHLEPRLGQVIGDDAADLIDSVQAIAERMPEDEEEENSAVHMVGQRDNPTEDRHSRPTPIVPPPSGDTVETLPAPAFYTVGLATSDHSVHPELDESLRGRAEVLAITDVISLLDTLSLVVELDVLVIDLAAPCIRVPTLVTIEEQLPPGMRVIVWSPTPHHEHLRACQERDWLPVCGDSSMLLSWIEQVIEPPSRP